jgi:UDP-3-O-[3-hydroxymyristoyl] glucosamine N-acyltransferase
MNTAELAEKLGGELEGDGSVEITNLSGLHDAQEGDLTFLSNPRYKSAVADTKASAVVVADKWDAQAPCPVIKVSNPDKAFAMAASLLGPEELKPVAGVHSSAVVADDVALGDNVSVGPCAVIESGVKLGARTVVGANCFIGSDTLVGDDCRFYPQSSTREGTVIGNRVIVHNGAVIGSDGFGNYREDGEWKKIPQIGTVEIGDDAEIGANVTIDRARFGKTVIGKGVKIDNLVQIAHNVKIGDNAAMAAQAGISGSSVIGKDVQLGGQAGIAGHLEVGEGAIVGGQAGVTKDVPGGSFVSGYPAMPHKEAAKRHAYVARIPELKKKVRELEKRIEELEGK